MDALQNRTYKTVTVLDSETNIRNCNILITNDNLLDKDIVPIVEDIFDSCDL